MNVGLVIAVSFLNLIRMQIHLVTDTKLGCHNVILQIELNAKMGLEYKCQPKICATESCSLWVSI